MKGWWTGAAVSVAAHLALFALAVTSDPPAERTLIRFTVRDVPPREERVEREAERARRAEARARADRERVDRERADRARADRERADRERADPERLADSDRADRERADSERADRERVDRERRADEKRADQERAHRERADRARADRERADVERADRARADGERRADQALDRSPAGDRARADATPDGRGPAIPTTEDGAVTVAPRYGEPGGSIGPAAPGSVARLAPGIAAPRVEDAPILPPAPPPSAPYTELRPQAGGGYVSKHRSFTARIEHDGTIEFEDHIAGYTGLGFWFDVTDTVMAIGGDDAYAAAKRRVLEDTRDLRVAMAAEACEERLDETLYALKSDLEGIWTDPKLSTDAKRRMIFQLWDDCAEEGEASVVAHGRMARITIVEFVKKALPAGSPFAYTRDELVALNERRASKAPFEPYTP